jgi:hypothetical protein
MYFALNVALIDGWRVAYEKSMFGQCEEKLDLSSASREEVPIGACWKQLDCAQASK